MTTFSAKLIRQPTESVTHTKATLDQPSLPVNGTVLIHSWCWEPATAAANLRKPAAVYSFWWQKTDA